VKRLSLKPAAWPQPDQILWSSLFQKGHPLDEAGPLSHLRPVSITGLEVTWGHWLGWVATERPDLLNLDPLTRSAPEVLQAWLASMEHLVPATASFRINSVLRVLKTLAPAQSLESHRNLARYYQRLTDRTPSSRKQGRIVKSGLLVDAGVKHYREHQDAAASLIESARACRDAIMVTLLALMPMRRRSFCSLELGRSVQRTPGGWRIVLDAANLKSGQYWEARVPEPAASLLTHYVDVVRPCLLVPDAQDARRLWLTKHGTPYKDGFLGVWIKKLTFQLIGVAIPPHFFRDCAATTLALSSAEHARGIRAILGHASERTSERHYNQASAIEAGRELQDIVLKRRKAAKISKWRS
jgi:integrase